MERPQCVVPPMGQTHLESGWASPSIQWWLLDQVLGSSVGTRTAALTHPCRGFLEEFLFCINVFTNDRQSLEKFPSKSLSHIALYLHKHQINVHNSAGSQREELRWWQRSWGRRLGIHKGGIEPQESPWIFSSIYPQKQSLPTLLLCALTADFTGGCTPPPFCSLWKRVNLQLQLIKFLGIIGVFKSKPLRWLSNLPDRFTWTPTAMHTIV